MAKQQKRLGEILVEWGIITAQEVQKALDHGKNKKMRVGEALIDLKLCSEPNVYKALAQQQNMEYVELDKSGVSPTAVNDIPDDLMRKYLILPLGKENGKMKVAIHDPLDFEMQEIMRFRLGKEIRPVLAPKGRIKSIIDELFNTTSNSTIDKTMDKTIDRLRDSLDKSVDKSLDRSIDKSIDVSSMGEETANDPVRRRSSAGACLIASLSSPRAIFHRTDEGPRAVRYRIDVSIVRDRIPLR